MFPGHVNPDDAAPRPVAGGVLSHGWLAQIAASIGMAHQDLSPSFIEGANYGHFTLEPTWNGLTRSTNDLDHWAAGWVQFGQVAWWFAAAAFDDTTDDLSTVVPAPVPILDGNLPCQVGNVYILRGGNIWNGVAIHEDDAVTFWAESGRLNQTKLGAGPGYIHVTGFYRTPAPADPRQLRNPLGA